MSAARAAARGVVGCLLVVAGTACGGVGGTAGSAGSAGSSAGSAPAASVPAGSGSAAGPGSGSAAGPGSGSGSASRSASGSASRSASGPGSAAGSGSAVPGPAARSAAPTRSAPGTPAATPAGRRPVVVLDPGHNGGNATHYAEISRLVEAGNGRRKPCNEVGTSTDAGYPEHAFAWDVVVRLRALLAARGIDVRLTRGSDTGVGPCVDVRGRYGNPLRADAVVSVHADGAAPAGSGFHVIETPDAPAATRRLALAVRASMRAGSGLDYADYVAGGDGLDARDDLAGLNLSTRPSVLVECGNMRNRADTARQTTPAGRQRMAAALATGILDYLGR